MISNPVIAANANATKEPEIIRLSYIMGSGTTYELNTGKQDALVSHNGETPTLCIMRCTGTAGFESGGYITSFIATTEENLVSYSYHRPSGEIYNGNGPSGVLPIIEDGALKLTMPYQIAAGQYEVIMLF